MITIEVLFTPKDIKSMTRPQLCFVVTNTETKEKHAGAFVWEEPMEAHKFVHNMKQIIYGIEKLLGEQDEKH